MECPNLKTLFGDRYKVEYEESYYAERGTTIHRVEEPWYMQIPCRYGHIGVWDVDRLCASVDGHPNISSVLRKHPSCRIEQHGDFGELTVSFTVEVAEEILGVMRPRVRRRLSPEQREAQVERLKEYWKSQAQSEPTDEER